MKKLVVVFIMLLSACGGFHDTILGEVDPELQPYVDQIYTWAIEYGAYDFAERIKFVDYRIVEEFTKTDTIISDTQEAQSTIINHERITEFSNYYFDLYNEDERLCVLLHETYHAVSDEHESGKQHIDTKINDIPLSIMNSGASSIGKYFQQYKDYYLQQLFSMRLDRIWK